MIQPKRKSSEYTNISPFSTDKTKKFHILPIEASLSKQTSKSRYTNKSKLTKSKLFETLSKGTHNKMKETLLERDTEIEILQNTLEISLQERKNLLYKLS